MLPWEKKKQPMVVGSESDDLMKGATERVMSRFINAVQSQNLPEAIEAWEQLHALKSVD